ncbi:Queuosine salvage protein [Pseudolycoriella hygida]|uniref:Queuosine 5'-phosphate N-glycosylase/hydrolase n=1 Tax=Pseudolycoriella hygida TaxID=35572 RepID=A0A9Q0N633_9DIPT|nr:Queuosine salvage protein [Pseudolycoriella hygida]
MSMNPRESGEFIVKNAKHLAIDVNGIQNLVKEVVEGIKTKQIDIENFSQHEHHPTVSDAYAPNWIFLIDTLNFCFWTPGDATKWKVNGYTGYFALCASINRAIKEGIDITNPAYYSSITVNELEHILRSDDNVTKCPLIEERVSILGDVGKKLMLKYDGNFKNCVIEAKNSAQALIKLVVNEFPCFKDEATYCNEKVTIYKRVQILVGDIWSCYRGEGLGQFDDIETVTMFADYRVPQVLVHFGAIKYSNELLDLLKKETILANGSPEEVEIRGASIYVVEQLKEMVLKEIKENCLDLSTKNVNSVLLDHFLWDYRRRFAYELEHIPFHKTISIYY